MHGSGEFIIMTNSLNIKKHLSILWVTVNMHNITWTQACQRSARPEKLCMAPGFWVAP